MNRNESEDQEPFSFEKNLSSIDKMNETLIAFGKNCKNKEKETRSDIKKHNKKKDKQLLEVTDLLKKASRTLDAQSKYVNGLEEERQIQKQMISLYVENEESLLQEKAEIEKTMIGHVEKFYYFYICQVVSGMPSFAEMSRNQIQLEIKGAIKRMPPFVAKTGENLPLFFQEKNQYYLNNPEATEKLTNLVLEFQPKKKQNESTESTTSKP
uniref:Uncharacterized protein n=1 Tax=Panagrolaimus sp. JU765 TaxID=591449 RepID=A0AC34Q8V6_9BILA